MAPPVCGEHRQPAGAVAQTVNQGHRLSLSRPFARVLAELSNFHGARASIMDPDSVQYAPDFALHAASFGLQELLKFLEFRD